MPDTPPVVNVTTTTGPRKAHVAWTVAVFLASCLFITALIVWQFAGLTPTEWCFIAKEGQPRDPTACLDVLKSLISVKDHIVIGLIGTLSIIIVSLAVVVLKVFVRVDGPGDVHFNIGEKDGSSDK